MTADPRSPVLVGSALLNWHEGNAEPIDLMTRVSAAAFDDSRSTIASAVRSVNVVRGIWPYENPGALVADRLGLGDVETGLTQLGGNEAFDMLNTNAQSIQDGQLDAVLICAAETMRTRRQDKAAGKKSAYLDEADGATPTSSYGSTEQLSDGLEFYAGITNAVNFYAMAETAVRHRNAATVDEHVANMSELWARAATVAATNTHAWMTEFPSAAEIAAVSRDNRLVAEPYPKLMTSNINVDQAAAVVMCSVQTALDHGVPRDQIVFLRSGSGGYESWLTRCRWAFDESPAMRIAGKRAAELAEVDLDDVTYLDLYSCFPSAIEVAQRELDIDVTRPFTITGGLTFAGGPFNSYCMQSLGRAIELVRAEPGSSALLSGNGGFFTKHAFTMLSGEPPPSPFRYERPQAEIDRHPTRPASNPSGPASTGTVECYTVTYDRSGAPERGIIASLDTYGVRTLSNSTDAATIDTLRETDACGLQLSIDLPGTDSPRAMVPASRLA